jgi:Skp family chaperone for outer membrane proteins
VATLGVAIYLGSRLWAQQGTQGLAAHPATSAKTKVAMLNLKYVVMNYTKWKNFTETLKSSYASYEQKAQALNTQMEGIKKQLQSADPATREKLTKDGKSLERQMQDLSDEAKNTLGKQEQDQMVIVYREIGAAVAGYAQSNDIDLVLHYNDAITDTEMNSPNNIGRKMMTAPTVPLYYAAGVDISAQILKMLNDNYAQAGGAAPAGGAH